MQDNRCRLRVEAEIIGYIPALYKFAHRFHRTESDVEDLVQDTLLKALGNLDKFQEGTSVKSWMFTIMRNAFCTKYARNKREQVGLDDVQINKFSTKPEQEWRVQGQEIEQAIAALNADHRKAVDLVILQGTSYEDAAVLCQCAVGTMKSRVNRARASLSRMLS
ncbi:sigma-70 family RNA polymerase sigma factor [Rhizobium sp. XQZ8]|uniref:sigma-70 family RNA polymerase sigma factor n=1 Tax=Rhizobium populisoli TaxID=2859785 RepID=UPI001CA5ECF0|nr:sigma-70 family RNA polymerase sigma factor [Rhizobium populisoli]MBW6425358.1 sigma-70 family RNA polymerase sigma factor [Rhizobium populisoli]